MKATKTFITMAEVEQRPSVPAAQELPVEGKTVKALTLLGVKRTFDLFTGNHGQKVPLDEERSASPPLPQLFNLLDP